MNDGASLAAIAARSPFLGARTAVLLMMAWLIAAPLLVGIGVARTITDRLVSFGDGDALGPLLVAVVATAAVAGSLARRGLPTSITLALVGAIVGSGLGHGLRVDWSTAGTVLVIAMLAPLVGIAVGIAVARTSDRITLRINRRIRVVATHTVGFTLLGISYGANAGQSMIAMWILALRFQGSRNLDQWQFLIIIGVLFGIGAMIGLPRLGGPFGRGIVAIRPAQAASAELAAAIAVLGSTALGAPVSIIQVLTAALVGTGLKDGHHQVRWKNAMRTAVAWYLTFPAAMTLAAIMGLVVRVVEAL